MAKRDKLTKRQERQVASNQSRKLHKLKTPELENLSPLKSGLLISRFGEQADILDTESRQTFRCYLRQNLGAPVPGDKVSFRLDPNLQGVVEVLHPRESLMQRPSPHQGLKPVVANINRVFVVVAPLPDFSALLLDRYLVALTDADLPVVILLNKAELIEEVNRQAIDEQLAIYAELGYPLIRVSCSSGAGFDQLTVMAEEQQSILVGQSGVGKSSIINRLFPQQSQTTNQVSENSRLGQHTTTSSQLFMFDNHSGFIIDSPGIREFGLWHLDESQIARGFVDFADYLGSCKFRDCKHLREPGCAIIHAVEQGQIAKSRWQSYCGIIQSSMPD